MPGALHVLGGEWPAVVPIDARAQLERELGVGGVPGPAFGEIGYHRIQAVSRFFRIEAHEVVEHGHERHVGRDRRFFVDRGGGRLRRVEDTQRTAGFRRLRRGRCGSAHESDCQQSHPAPGRTGDLDLPAHRFTPSRCEPGFLPVVPARPLEGRPGCLESLHVHGPCGQQMARRAVQHENTAKTLAQDDGKTETRFEQKTTECQSLLNFSLFMLFMPGNVDRDPCPTAPSAP